MIKTYKHYEKEVIFQQIQDKRFIDVLKENNVDYTELPILDYRVLLYHKEAENYYAIIVPVNAVEVYLENVYIAKEIPLDMDWCNLVEDINNQRSGDCPIELKTKAKLLCEKAEELALESEHKNDDDFFSSLDTEINPAYFRQALITLGYSIEEVLEMEHHDVNEEYLRRFLINA